MSSGIRLIFARFGLLIDEFVPRMQLDDVVMNSEAGLTCGCIEEMMREYVFVLSRDSFR